MHLWSTRIGTNVQQGNKREYFTQVVHRFYTIPLCSRKSFVFSGWKSREIEAFQAISSLEEPIRVMFLRRNLQIHENTSLYIGLPSTISASRDQWLD